MKKFPSIEQFRNVIKQVHLRHDYVGKVENSDEPVYQHTSDYPTLTFKGTVKLHGTNAAVVKYANGSINYQSRENVLSLQKDNMKFMLSMSNKNLEYLFADIPFNDHIAIYGEWCGQGIQSGVGISELPTMFVIFGCMVDDVWIDYYKSDSDQLIFNIHDFMNYECVVDFNHPEVAQNTLYDFTMEVEKECPVAKHFGIEGIGEGIVWTCDYDGQHLMFKTKGDKHSVSKVKTVAQIDIDVINSINEFVDYTLTENRLKQGLDKLEEMGLARNQSSTGPYLKWVVDDILREENDTIVANQLDVKKVCSTISLKARVWFFNSFKQ